MKRFLSMVVLLLVSTPAFAATFINVGADSANFPSGTLATSGAWSGAVPITDPRKFVDFPSSSTNNCVIFDIPAVPQTMSNSPSLVCTLAVADANVSPTGTVTFAIYGQAYPVGDQLVGAFTSAVFGQASYNLGGSAQNRISQQTGFPSSFVINKAGNVACGSECLGSPLALQICRISSTSPDTARLYSLTCQE